MLPNFIVIGGMKCGTTALLRYLRLHPQIYLPPKLKNIEFFNDEINWQKGIKWYSSFFQVKDEQLEVAGEISTEYAKFPMMPNVPQRMASVLPEVKIIYLIRHPIKRIISQYIHLVSEGTEKRSIDEALSDLGESDYIYCSMYYFQLQQYLTYFAKDRILLVTSEDLRDRHIETLQKIFRFVGVDDSFRPPSAITRNTREEKRRWNILGRLIKNDAKHFDYYNWYLSRMPTSNFMRMFLQNLVSSPIKHPHISEKTKDNLLKDIRPDYEKICNYAGFPADMWDLEDCGT